MAPKRDSSYYAALGRKGGTATSQKRGSAFYREIGKKGGEKVKAALELLKKTEEGK